MPHLIRSTIRNSAFSAFVLITLGLPASQAQVNVLTHHNDNLRDGVNPSESILTPSNVNTNQFGMLFKVALDDQPYAQPLVDSSVTIAGSTRSVVYIATANNSVYAFDANNGSPYWHVNFGNAFRVGDVGFGCTDVLDSSGIMSTPVIDNSNNTLYVVAQTYVSGTSTHNLHALNLATGAEQPGSPVQVQANGFNSVNALQRTALLLANGNVYFSFASHCDFGTWKGLTFAYNAGNLSQVGVFNASPSDNGNGIWQSGNGDAADSAGNVYWVTGNGSWDGVNNFSETMLKATPYLALEDWHTPSDYTKLDAGDADLTSSGPLLLANTNLLVAGGKDGILHLINTENMGHLGDAAAVQNWQATSSHIHSLNFFNSNLYEWGQSDYLKVFHFNGSTFNTPPTFTGNIQAIGHPGASLSISANGQTNGILWAATNLAGPNGQDAWHMTEPGILYAYNVNGMTALWNNRQNATRDSCDNFAKFMPPTIANGKVYLPSFGTAQTRSGQLCVYGELGSNLIPDGTYVITSVYSKLALDDPGFSMTDGQVMEQYTVNKGPNQQWRVQNLGNNVITLTNGSSAQALEVVGGSKSNSALVDQWPYQGNPWQQWTVHSLSGGAYQLTNVNSGLALDIDGGGTTIKEQIDQYPYQGNSWQQWIFTSK